MKRIVFRLLLLAVFIPFLSCNQHQLDSNMLPVTTKSDSAAQLYFDAWDAFHYEGLPGIRKTMDKAIEQDSNFFSAYAIKALTYEYFGNKEKYVEVANQALACDIKLNKAETVTKEIMEAKLADYEADVAGIVDQYVDYYPDVPEAYSNVSFYYMGQQNYEKAVEMAQKAVNIDDSNPSSYINLGYALMSLERFEEAEKVFDKYMELLPDAPNVYDSRGDLFMAMEKYELAYENFMKAHELGWSENKALKAKEMLDELSVPEEGKEK